jgi:hypothetical protein
MNTIIVESKKELIFAIGLIELGSPDTAIINHREDGSKTTYTFKPMSNDEWDWLNYDKHIKKILTNIRKIPKGYFE